MPRSKSSILQIAAALFLTNIGQAQIPAPETRTVHIKVAYGDLHLDDPKDAHTFMSRLTEAAKIACGPVVLSPGRADVVPASAENDYKACVATAIGDVIARLNVPQVSRVYAASRAGNSNKAAKR